MDVIKAGSYRIRDLGQIYIDAGYDIMWCGGEQLPPELREKYLRDGENGIDWWDEDNVPFFCLMLEHPQPEHAICFVEVMEDWMHLRLHFSERIYPGVSRAAVYKYVNRVNVYFKLLRAYFDRSDSVVFEYWLLLTHGVHRHTLTASTEFFMSVAQRAINELDREKVLATNRPFEAGME